MWGVEGGEVECAEVVGGEEGGGVVVWRVEAGGGTEREGGWLGSVERHSMSLLTSRDSSTIYVATK